ncbi:MAG TPA: maleylpyruvate isomerase N-terminal domain-containing protein [Candidatus Limnocylindrales bacterium]|nr:maleylpyruvate isomerase N-terminal domain-containing protein [Candidatus Limnocylindrales bacterium]
MITTRNAIEMCLASHMRLINTVSQLDDATVRKPSILPGWTIGHVLTHVARNADGHVHRLEGVLRGEDVPRYPGGLTQRDADIEDGAERTAEELLDDVTSSAVRLQETWRRCETEGWPNAHLLGSDSWRTTESPLRRLREVEIHHADLGLDYTAEDWPDAYVQWELAATLSGVPERLDGDEKSRIFLSWLIGRSDLPPGFRLADW